MPHLINDRRRDDDRRTPGRRLVDRIAKERQARHLRLEDPVRIALWDLEVERANARDRRRVARMRELLGGLS